MHRCQKAENPISLGKAFHVILNPDISVMYVDANRGVPFVPSGDRSDTYLVAQSEILTTELVRISLIQSEKWCIGLEEASRQYYIENSVDSMLSIIRSLNRTLFEYPATDNEVQFFHTYRDSLIRASEWITLYERTRARGCIDQSWVIYYEVFQKLHKEVSALTELRLSDVSPILAGMDNFGLYVPGADGVRIKKISDRIEIIQTKQKPKIIHFEGDNGKIYRVRLSPPA
jgi:FKBP12-rapamycin complex-associated protein